MSYRHGGLGFWSAIVPVATSVYGAVKGSDDRMPSDEYYPAVLAGRQLCPGPYNIDQVAAALAANPELDADVRAVLAVDAGAWPKYGNPTTPKQKAAVLVNWAHGGRNCAVTAGETGATMSRSTIERALALATPTYGGAPSQSMGDGRTPTTAAPAPGGEFLFVDKSEAKTLAFLAGAVALGIVAMRGGGIRSW